MPSATHVPFQAHVELLRFFLSRRDEVVERIHGLLNAQRKSPEHAQDKRTLSAYFEDCFFGIAGLASDQSRLRGQLQQAHWARGFEPRESPEMSNDLIDAAELMKRGVHFWTRTRWPGGSGRVNYAHTLFNLYLLRQLALLSMRVWDAGRERAGERLGHVQGVLDELWRDSPPGHPVLVREAGTLIPVALSPATEELAPYFDVAENIATSFADEDRVAILKAVVRMGGGHLRSYLHYYITQKGAVLDERSLVLLTRKSDALDFSLLIHGLVPLLAAYERAVSHGDLGERRDLADAICQGISPDPELFINRVEQLAAYSMVEYLFTEAGADGGIAYTALGRRHVELLDEYAALIARLAKPLYEDCVHFRPVEGAYSPYGALYGFSSNLLEHMALKLLDRDADTRFGIEDVFTGGGAEKVAWVSGWRKLPHVNREITKLYAYPHWFAERMFARIEHALRLRAVDEPGAADAAAGARRTGRLIVAPSPSASPSTASGTPPSASPTARPTAASTPPTTAVPAAELPARFVVSSDPELVAAGKAQARDEARLLSDRQEGHFLLSYETPNGWVAITKDVLTDVLGEGADAVVSGLPAAALEALALMGRSLVVR